MNSLINIALCLQTISIILLLRHFFQERRAINHFFIADMLSGMIISIVIVFMIKNPKLLSFDVMFVGIIISSLAPFIYSKLYRRGQK